MVEYWKVLIWTRGCRNRGDGRCGDLRYFPYSSGVCERYKLRSLMAGRTRLNERPACNGGLAELCEMMRLRWEVTIPLAGLRRLEGLAVSEIIPTLAKNTHSPSSYNSAYEEATGKSLVTKLIFRSNFTYPYANLFSQNQHLSFYKLVNTW